MLKIMLAAALTAVFIVPAHAQFRAGGTVNCDDRYPHTCDVRGFIPEKQQVLPKRQHFREHGKAGRKASSLRSHSDVGTEILPHPAGCPRRAFCGCGAAVRVFGAPIRALWLAAEWIRRFPPTAPAPGMVAARRGHVFVIEQVLGGGRVLAYDANSGGRKTRRHVRSLAGFSVRNPYGSS